MNLTHYDTTAIEDLVQRAWPFSVVVVIVGVALAGALVARGAASLFLRARRWNDRRFWGSPRASIPADEDFDEYIVVRGVWRGGAAGELPTLEVNGRSVPLVGEVEVVDSGRGSGMLRDGDVVLALGTLRCAAALDATTHYRGQTRRWELVDELAPIAVRATRVDHRHGSNLCAQTYAAALATLGFCAAADGEARRSLRETPAPTETTQRCDDRGVVYVGRRSPEARMKLELASLVPWRRAAARELLAQEVETSRAFAPGDFDAMRYEAENSRGREDRDCSETLRAYVNHLADARVTVQQREADRLTVGEVWADLVSAFERGEVDRAWTRTCPHGETRSVHDDHPCCRPGPLPLPEALAAVPLVQASATRASLACLVHARANLDAPGANAEAASEALTHQTSTACQYAGAVLGLDRASEGSAAVLVRLAHGAGPGRWRDAARGALLLLSLGDDRPTANHRGAYGDPGAWFYRLCPRCVMTVLDDLQRERSSSRFARLGPGAVGAALSHRGGTPGDAWRHVTRCAHLPDVVDNSNLGEALSCGGSWDMTLGSLERAYPGLQRYLRPRWAPGPLVEEAWPRSLDLPDDRVTELLRVGLYALAEERPAPAPSIR